jgi:hypothetical protein
MGEGFDQVSAPKRRLGEEEAGDCGRVARLPLGDEVGRCAGISLGSTSFTACRPRLQALSLMAT